MLNLLQKKNDKMINENKTDIPIYKDINFVLKNSKALILDIWGVLWDGIEVYPEAIDTLKKIKELNIPVILLSNAPRKASKVKKKLNAIGIKKEFYKEIISSGEICRSALLSKNFVVPGEHYYFIGLKEDKDLLSGSHFSEAKNMNSADFVLLTGPRSFNDTLSEYKDELTKCFKLRLPIISANPDKIVIRQNGKTVICAGELAKLYTKMGGTVKEFGKPHKEIFITALKSISKLRSTISKKNISIIGDGLETDIAGGNAIGINTILITDGILSKELKTEGKNMPDKKLLSKILERYKTIPNAAAVRFTITL